MAQLAEEVKDAVLGNVGTMVIFRVGAPDATDLEQEMMPRFIPEDLINLPKFAIYLKLMIDGVSSAPFSAQTLPPIAKVTGSEDKVVRGSRERYGRTKAEVEAGVLKWIGFEEGADVEAMIAESKARGAGQGGGGGAKKKKVKYKCSWTGKEFSIPVTLDRSRPIYSEEGKEEVAELKKSGKYDSRKDIIYDEDLNAVGSVAELGYDGKWAQKDDDGKIIGIKPGYPKKPGGGGGVSSRSSSSGSRSSGSNSSSYGSKSDSKSSSSKSSTSEPAKGVSLAALKKPESESKSSGSSSSSDGGDSSKEKVASPVVTTQVRNDAPVDADAGGKGTDAANPGSDEKKSDATSSSTSSSSKTSSDSKTGSSDRDSSSDSAAKDRNDRPASSSGDGDRPKKRKRSRGKRSGGGSSGRGERNSVPRTDEKAKDVPLRKIQDVSQDQTPAAAKTPDRAPEKTPDRAPEKTQDTSPEEKPQGKLLKPGQRVTFDE